MNKVLIFLIGFLLVAAGLGMVLKNWVVLAAMVKASAGVLIALIGVIMMFSASIRR